MWEQARTTPFCQTTANTKTTTEKKASDDGDPDGDALRSPSEEKKTPPFDVVSRTARFLADGDACVPDVLVHATLRLLLNLSFHERARDAMHERALLPRLCVLAKKKAFERVALATLYNLSVDKRRRRFFAVASPTAGTDLVLDALLETPDADLIAHACPIVAGLAVNLSCDARCAEALAARENGKPFVSFLKRRLMRRDALGLKVAAFSCLTNWAAGVTDQPLSHDEVMETGRSAAAVLSRLLASALPRGLDK